MAKDLVTVICLSHNHEPFIRESVESVINQTYEAVEIILVDDASSDGSKEVLNKLARQYPISRFIDLNKNLGNCAAFNKALKYARGRYIIDLATDDVMEKYRIEKQVEHVKNLPSDYGVVHSDATVIDVRGQKIREHFKYLKKHNRIKEMPEGDVYLDLIQRYFVAPPTMMIKKEVFDDLNGYDENLSYEDFDFWIRSSRKWKYAYLDQKLTKVRTVKDGLSSRWYKPGDKQLYSTYLVCKKIAKLNVTDSEDSALIKRVRYELRQSVFTDNKREALLFYEMLKEMKALNFKSRLLNFLNGLPVKLASLRKILFSLKYN